MYAVAKDGDCTVKYVEVAGNHLILRPHNQAYPIEVMTMEDAKTAADYLVAGSATWRRDLRIGQGAPESTTWQPVTPCSITWRITADS